MPRGAFVVNRFHLPPPRVAERVTIADAAAGLASLGITLEDDARSTNTTCAS